MASTNDMGDSMTRRRLAGVLGTVTLLAACGAGGSAEDTTTSLLPPVSTTVATTTTTTAPTTTTTTAAQNGSASPELLTIRAAMAQSAAISSGRMEGSIQVFGMVGEGGVTDMTIPYSGSFDAVSGNSSFAMDLSVFADAAAVSGEEIPAEFADMFGEMEIRTIDGVSYIKFPFFGMMFGADTPWISAPAEEGDDLTGEFTFGQAQDPTEMLSRLEDADATVTEVGRETVNGVETTHWMVVFDTEALLAEATPEERAEMEAQGMFPEGELPMDIWISDDGYVIRYVMDIAGDPEPGTAEQFERMVVTFDLFDIDQPVTIVAPDPAEVTDIESLAGGFFGSTGG